MKKIILCSLVAMMAVTAANAEIASVQYLEAKTGDIATLTTTAKSNLTAAVNELNTGVQAAATKTALEQGLATKQATIDDLADIRDGAALGATSFQSADVVKKLDQIEDGKEDELVPTLARTEDMINNSQTDLIAAVSDNTDAIATNAENITKNAQAIEGLDTTYVSEDEMTAFKNSNTDAIADAKKAGTDAATALEEYTEASDAAFNTITAAITNLDDTYVSETEIGIGENFAIPDECKAADAVCSLVVRAGVAGWEKIRY